MPTGPYWCFATRIGGIEDYNIVISLVLHDNTMQVSKWARVGNHIKCTLAERNRVGQRSRRAQEVGHVCRGRNEATLEILGSCHTSWIIDQAGILVE